MSRIDPKCASRWLITFAVMTLASTDAAAAQERPAPAIELAAGALVFADDGIVSERGVGVGSRFYFSPRVSIGPEIVYVSGQQHSHLILTGNTTFDLVRPRSGTPRVTPFIVAGGGIFQTRETFPNSRVFTHVEGAFTAGGGVRVPGGERLFVGAEARVGWELHFRVNGIVGIRIGS